MRRRVAVLLSAMLLFFAGASATYGATLSLAPSAASYHVGDTFTATVLVSSPEQAINAVSSEISYPADMLRFDGASENTSVVNYWTVEPGLGAGNTVALEGLILNPGYTGASATVAELTFTVLSPGSATLGFASASVLADDGHGTSVLAGISPATYVFTAKEPAIEAPAVTQTPPSVSTSAPSGQASSSPGSLSVGAGTAAAPAPNETAQIFPVPDVSQSQVSSSPASYVANWPTKLLKIPEATSMCFLIACLLCLVVLLLYLRLSRKYMALKQTRGNDVS